MFKEDSNVTRAVDASTHIKKGKETKVVNDSESNSTAVFDMKNQPVLMNLKDNNLSKLIEEDDTDPDIKNLQNEINKPKLKSSKT